MRSFRKLLAAVHSLLVIEHNLDVIRAADWLIDLGPKGGDAGGQVIGTGTPQQLMENPASYTGKALRDYASDVLAMTPAAPSAALAAAEPQPGYADKGTPLQS